MSTLYERVESTLNDHGGLLVRRDHPTLDSAIGWLARRGELVRILPGIYCAPGWQHDPMTRIRAATLWCPNAVLTGAAAARVSFWPKAPMEDVTLALPSRRRHRDPVAAKIRLEHRSIPPELVEEEGELRFTDAALTAIDLCPDLGGSGIDTALRTGAATVEAMWEALRLTPNRSGNALRRRYLAESRTLPWSWLERQVHRLLHEAGVAGWLANFPVATATGQYFIDVAFPEAMLAIDLDGWEYHASKESFESDRHRQNWLVTKGWRVLRFTRAMVEQEPERVLAQIKEALGSSPQSRRTRHVAS